GRFVYLGLHNDGSPTFEKLVGRLVLVAAGRTAAPPVGVGLVGYGAIGREHAASITAISGLRLAGVCDISPRRREAAERDWSVRVHAHQDDLLNDPDIGLVVVGTPPSAHADPVLAALDAGKHVVCEKPFGLHVEEVDRMIDAAASRGLLLTVFQSRRWDPDYLAMHEVARSGRIGEPFYMESFIGGHGHPCDFWHSHEPISGGTIYDWGDEPVPADFPARVKVFRAAEEGAHEEVLSLPRRDEHGFYRNLADHLAWGEPLAVTPEEARRTVAVMEAATRSIAKGGAQLKVEI